MGRSSSLKSNATASKRNSSAADADADDEPVSATSRPKRRVTNAHIFRYLQHGNPDRLQDRDLKRALEASLEECSDLWPAEDTASCSSSDQSNAPSASISSSGSTGAARNSSKQHGRSISSIRDVKRSEPLECNCPGRQNSSRPPTMPQCPVHTQKRPKVHKRYKPVAKKNIYYEADFFHEGIMEFISFELVKFSILGDPERMKRIQESMEKRNKTA